MSIIHDALKKVQQSLSPKPVEPPPPLSGTTQKGDTYLYATPPPVIETPSSEKKKSVGPNLFLRRIRSLFTFICALAICATSLWYLYQQYRNDIPRLERSAKKSFYQLIHKEEIPDFKTKRPEDLKPLVKISIPPPVTPPAVNTTQAAPTAAPPPPATLNVHGIMSDSKGNLALINDQVYQAGDEVDGAKIIKIDLNSITVNINGEEKTIFVKN
jgi:hypothetical protein